MLGKFYNELVFQMVFLSHNSILMNEAEHSMKSGKNYGTVCHPSCSLVAISIVLFMTHHDDFHMGAELYIHLLLAFHDF